MRSKIWVRHFNFRSSIIIDISSSSHIRDLLEGARRQEREQSGHDVPHCRIVPQLPGLTTHIEISVNVDASVVLIYLLYMFIA